MCAFRQSDGTQHRYHVRWMACLRGQLTLKEHGCHKSQIRLEDKWPARTAAWLEHGKHAIRFVLWSVMFFVYALERIATVLMGSSAWREPVHGILDARLKRLRGIDLTDLCWLRSSAKQVYQLVGIWLTRGHLVWRLKKTRSVSA